MATPEEERLLQFLGSDIPSDANALPLGGRANLKAFLSAPQASEADRVAALREALLQDPETVLASAPALLGSSPSLNDGLQLLNDAESALRNAEGTLVALKANRSEKAYELPPQHRFPGYDHNEIPIFPDRTRFETIADAAAWVGTAAVAWRFRLVTRKPTLPSPAADAVYPLQTRNGEATVALFSDWGNGYYHSQYIVRHIARLNAAQAIHLGDVYYTGTQGQFDAHFRPILAPLLKEMPVYAMNANHEMDSHGIPYLAYLAEKRRLGTQPGFVQQPQETSYFCLVNDRYQVVAIDTAFHGNGRCTDGLRDWLEKRLREGKQAGRTTILLSQNEPYGPTRRGSVGAHATLPLLKDLRTLVDDGLIHLWFWGDEHYAALYESSDTMPFVGSCIGHGGYPFSAKKRIPEPDGHARVHWAEYGSRFEGIEGLREDRGNNGFCFLRLQPDEIELCYIDWRFRERKKVKLRRDNDRLRIM